MLSSDNNKKTFAALIHVFKIVLTFFRNTLIEYNGAINVCKNDLVMTFNDL